MTKQEAIEVYKGLQNTKIIEAFQTLVPELANSDELIRKRLINLIKELAENKVPIMTSGYFEAGQDKDYIAYLEKQGGQKSVNKRHRIGVSAFTDILTAVREIYDDESVYELKEYLTELIKQEGENTIKVFEPTPGTTIDMAARQAIKYHEKLGKEVLLRFNGIFILINDSSTENKVVNKYRERFCKWGEEDIKMIDELLEIAEGAGWHKYSIWLKSLRNNIKGK